MVDMSTLGPMGRAIEDLALVLPLIAGPDDVDPLVGAAPVGDHRMVAVEGLRIGFYTHDGITEPTPGTVAAVERAAAALADAGALVDAAAPPTLTELPDLAFRMMAADGAAQARADLAAAGGRHVPQVPALLEALRPFALSAEEFFALMRRWAGLRAEIRRFVARFDAVLCPVAAGPAPLHGCRPSDDAELTDYDEFAYSFAYAVAGLPAASVPAGGERGLPVGVQVVAHAFRDDVALAVAAALERELSGEILPLPGLPV
jgi:Asp-tRNA(Asn)/Glu-tRNA(Gln) amidotransferase A subunit family amidase